MSRVDGRKVSHEVRESIRFEAIQKWLDGASVQALSVEYSTDRSCIYRWIDRYKKGVSGRATPSTPIPTNSLFLNRLA